MNHAGTRREAIARAQQYLAKEPVYLDTETTGVRSSAEIIEISIVDHNGESIFDTLVRPRHPIPSDATRIHHITNAMVVDAPTWDTIWPQLEALLASRTIGIFNSDFDLRLLRQSHQHAGLVWPEPVLDAFCIMNLYAQFYGEWDNYRQSYRWQSLDKAQRFCKIPLRNTHRAKDDALLARAVLQYMASAT